MQARLRVPFPLSRVQVQGGAGMSAPYPQHPLSAAFPGMSADDHATLTADIAANGLHDPITLYAGQVLDGWHRYTACMLIGVQARFTTLPKGTDPVAFVVSRNLHRRHLTGSQRAEAVTACSEWATVGSNQHGGCELGLQTTSAAMTGEVLGNTPRTLSEMAKEADVSKSTIQHAKAAHIAGLGEAVRDGRITAKQGAAIAKLPKEDRAAAVENPAILKEPKPAPHPAPELPTVEMVTITRAEYDELKADRDEMAVMNEELLAEQKAIGAVLDADDQLAEAAKRIKMLTAQVATLTSSRDGYMNGKNEVLNLLSKRNYQIKMLEKELAPYRVKLDSGGMPI